MKTSWLLATLLPLFLFSCALPEKQCQCKDNVLKIQRVTVHGNVSVPCPMFTAVEMTFKLHKGQNITATVTYVNASHKSSPEPLGSKMYHSVKDDNTTHFLLYNVTMDATGLYTCTAEKSYPPPMVTIQEEPQTIVIVENHGCVQNSQRMDPSASHLPLWVGFGILSVYCLIITCIALSLRFRLKREDMSTHDYMNMKPRTRRKKQGIHHPTHHSWYNDTTNGTAVSKKLPTKGTSV
ncbi:T-cell-specific surface glycoprotein CD28 isoform X1 [Ictalurus punctatus]|uniref:T-cell-specific surface glycoprotein CD28 isoform X1 n=1 Tax=Ictalurus punctatus TaxID=7998 RepID=A0A2D0Q7Q5_ICTPU|nr:T-cell-specific surface glycoprotein CD28 isoform X1 [Ictalurus punctatus]